jgi:hypothetical protein
VVVAGDRPLSWSRQLLAESLRTMSGIAKNDGILYSGDWICSKHRQTANNGGRSPSLRHSRYGFIVRKRPWWGKYVRAVCGRDVKTAAYHSKL